MSQRYFVDGEITRQYTRFNATGSQVSVRLLPPPPDYDPITHFLVGMLELFEYALRNCIESDMVRVAISNEVNVQEKPIGINFRRKDQLSEEVIRSMLEKVALSNARFNAKDRLIVVVHTVKMPVDFSHTALRSKGRTLANLDQLKIKPYRSKSGKQLFVPCSGCSNSEVGKGSQLPIVPQRK